jgi:RNA polymerase sigma-70 factor (ECF subfamily)
VTPVYRYLYKWLGNAKDAEDLTSQVFIDVLEGLVRYRERGNFAAWLFTIARRKVIAVYRQQRPTRPLEEVDNEQASTRPLGEQMFKRTMAALFAELAGDERNCCACASGRPSYAEIAA